MKTVAAIVIAFWIGAGALLLPLAAQSDEVKTIDAAQTLPRDAESTRALIRERDAFPGTDTPVAVIVYVRDDGLTANDRAAVQADRAALAKLARDNTIPPAIPSADGKALLLSVPIAGDLTASYDTVQQIKQRLSQAPQGLQTAVTGSASVVADAHDAFGGVETTLLLAAAIVVAVILLLTYRSPILWIVPLITVGVASQLALGFFYLLGRHAGVTVTDATNGITLVLLFGAGTDYALLIIARYRDELRKHESCYIAMASALRRSLPALLASAGTVTLGLLCLLAAQMNDVRGLGPIAAAGIAVTLAVVATLLPALLVLLGRWVFWPFIPRFGSSMTIKRPLWTMLVGKHPRAIWALATLLLAALSLGVLGLRPGQPADAAYTHEVGSVTGQRLVADHFPSGASSPVRIITNALAADRVVSTTEAISGVAAVTRGSGFSLVPVEAVLDDKADSPAARATVERIRQAVHAIPGADALVGGETAVAIDISRSSARDDAVLMPVILLVVFIVLVLLLRAVVAPLLLTLSVMLSYTAAMGLAGLVFQTIGYPGMQPNLPLWGYIFLVTLGVDYTIFLMTRAREEVGRHGNREGILAGLSVTGGVITSAGVVLAATFGTLILLPVVTAIQIGTIVALGVLLDTFVVRTLLVPALAIDLGPRLWWPQRPPAPPSVPHHHRDSVELAA